MGRLTIWGLRIVPNYVLPGGSIISEKELLTRLRNGTLPPEIGIKYQTVLDRFRPRLRMFASTAEASKRLRKAINQGTLKRGDVIGAFFRIVDVRDKTIRPLLGYSYSPLGETDLLLKTFVGTQVELQQAIHLRSLFGGLQYSPIGHVSNPDEHPSGLLDATLKRRGRKTWKFLPISTDIQQMTSLLGGRLRKDPVWKKLQKSASRIRK